MGPLWEGMQSCSRQVLGNVRQRFTADQQLHHFRQLDCQLISVGRSEGLLKVVATKAGRPSSTASTERADGARAWPWARSLPSPFPNDALGLHVVTPLFRTMVRLRLRLPIADSDMACPLCDGTSDSFGDHARVCPCGGDRVKRHNQLRNILAGRARAAGLQPEVEKPNLLPPRPELQGGTEDGSQPRGNSRRPAAVWIANWNLHGPAAFDVAVTSGLRQGHLAASAADGSKASMDYEVRKCHHLDTLQACATEGLQFIPLVVEACGGGWGPTALKRGGPSRPLSLPGQVKAAPWNCSACCRLSALRCTGRMPGQ